MTNLMSLKTLHIMPMMTDLAMKYHKAIRHVLKNEI